VIFDPTVKLDGEPWTCAPVHLFGEVEKLVTHKKFLFFYFWHARRCSAMLALKFLFIALTYSTPFTSRTASE
jgi:hypothetical protein